MRINNRYLYRQAGPRLSAVVNGLDKQIESLFAGLPAYFDFGLADRVIPPAATSAVRWYESEDGFHARFDVPGIESKDVQLTLEDDTLRLNATRGRRDSDAASAGSRYELSVALPDGVNREAISAQMEQGVLSITLPKAPKPQPRRIEVAVAQQL